MHTTNRHQPQTRWLGTTAVVRLVVEPRCLSISTRQREWQWPSHHFLGTTQGGRDTGIAIGS